DGPRGARRYVAALDALRGESYVAEFEHEAGAVRVLSGPRLVRSEEVPALAESQGARAVGPDLPDAWQPYARGISLLEDAIRAEAPVDLAGWEPMYGRLAEAQVKWEAAHGKALPR